MANLAGLVIGGVLLVVAGVVGRIGWKQHRRRGLVTETPTTEIRNLQDGGPVELVGEVTAEGTFSSPIRGEEAVLSAWEVEEWDERGKSGMWATLASGVYSRPFSIDDGTGEVRVEVGDHVEGEDGSHFDVQGPGIDIDRKLSTGVSVGDVHAAFDRLPVDVTVSPDRDPPDRITRFVEGESGVSAQTGSITNIVDSGNMHGERRYYEQTIEPGQEIYLLGEATTPDATYPLGPDDVVVEPPDGDAVMLVSDQSEASLVEDLGRYKLAYAGAAVIGVVGLGVFLFGVGVVPP